MKILNLITSFVLISTIVLLTNCSKTSTTPVITTTVTALKADQSISIYNAIETVSGDDAYVNSAAGLLIPLDSAFIRSGMTLAGVVTLSQPYCDSLIRLLSIPSGMTFAGVTGVRINFISGLGSTIFGDSTASIVYFNGMPATTLTPTVINQSQVYKLSSVLNVPFPTIAQYLYSDPDLSLFYEAFTKSNLSSWLTGTAYTIFVPNNEAFAAAGYPDKASIDAVDPNTLAQVLLFQTILNFYLPNELAAQSSLTSLQGESVSLTNSGGGEVLLGVTNATAQASVLTSGVLAGNVFAYKINNIIFP